MVKNFLIYTLILCLFTCNNKHENKHPSSFYLWQSIISIDRTELEHLQSYQCKELRIRLVDIVWNDRWQKPIPNAIATIDTSFLYLFHLTPVVFITNETMKQCHSSAIEPLADSILYLISQQMDQHKLSYDEIQLDCDWTMSTKDSYFQLIALIQQKTHKKISATLRLHQVKYKEKMGIPPCDKVNLMYYNVGKLEQNLAGDNSILNEKDVNKYIHFIAKYPLQMDISLPIYSWAVVFHQDKINHIVEKINANTLANSVNFNKITNTIYQSKQSQFVAGVYLYKGDLIKFEQITPKMLELMSASLSRQMKDKRNINIIFFNFETINLSIFKPDDFQKILSHFY